MNKIYTALSFLTFFLVALIMTVSGCSFIQNRVDGKMMSNEIDKIKVEIVNVSNLPEGRGYSIKLKNGSRYTIKQNNVYLGFPIKKPNGYSSNNFKVEATGNRLNIKPGEEFTLNAFAPIEEYKGNSLLDIENPQIEISGYINEVKDLNHFQSEYSAAFPK